MPHALWQIRRTLRRWQPDVVYFNDPHALTAAGLASVGLRIPLRVAARRVDFALQSIVRYQRMTDHVICVSNAVRDVCVAGGLDPRRLHVVHDGVDPERMGHGLREQGRLGLGIQSETILLLTVAKLTDHKGHRFFLEALPAIVRACPNLIWAVAGDGPLAADLHSQTRQLGLGEHVRFLGYRNDVAHLIAAANFMVVPSYMEGLCSSVVDAMLAGLPVIATRAGGIPDLLDARSPEESPVGWLVPPRNPPELAKAVLDAVRSAELVQQRMRSTPPGRTRVYRLGDGREDLVGVPPIAANCAGSAAGCLKPNWDGIYTESGRVGLLAVQGRRAPDGGTAGRPPSRAGATSISGWARPQCFCHRRACFRKE